MVKQVITPAVTATNIRKVRRRPRRPQQKFNLQSKPFQIVPFMIAPVLPGETMQNLLLQSRVITDPVKNRIIGWHKEYYYFYVPLPALKALDPNGLLQSMMLDPTVDVAALRTDTDVPAMYTYDGGIQYVAGCLNAVTEAFFRDEDELPFDNVIGDYPAAQIDQQTWLNSFKLEQAGEDDPELPGVDEIEELDILPGFETAYAQWELMRDHGMTDLDYDDFIRSYGVEVPEREEIQPDPKGFTVRPELIRFSRSWQYPSNTIDPTDGSATSAVSWSIAERADKLRFFRYPGFLFGVTVTRPKIYLGNQMGAAVGLLQDAYAWLPAVLHGHVYASLKGLTDLPGEDDTTVGIIPGAEEGFWFDCKDLFLYGDQFINYVASAAETHKVALPGLAGSQLGNVKYLTETMVDDLFVGANKLVREDGVTHLNILGKLTDTTP